MTPNHSSTRLLLTLIRLSGRAETASLRRCPSRPSIQYLSKVEPSLRSSYGTTKPRAFSDEDVDEARGDIAEEGSEDQKPRRPKASVYTPSDEIKIQPNPRILRRLPPDLKARRPKSAPIHHTAPDSKSESAKRSEPQSAADEFIPRPREHWQTQKAALKEKFGEQGWNPRKKLSPDTMEGIRALHEQFPEKYTTPVLAEQFKVSPEAIRRMLKSKWRASPEKMEERRVRWAKRHDRIWDAQAEMGLRPPRKKDRKPQGPEKLDEIIPLIPNIGP
jgi:Neugrin